MALTLEELGLGGLGSLGGPGWYGTHAPVRSFREGVSRLGGGGLAKTKMRMIWSQRRPAGFWASRRGQGWKRVSPGNMTPAMLRALLREIQKYEDVRGTDPDWRVTPPGSHRRRPKPRPRPAPRPRPRPRTGPVTSLLPAAVLQKGLTARRGGRRRPPITRAPTYRAPIYARGAPRSAGPIGYEDVPYKPVIRPLVSAGAFPPQRPVTGGGVTYGQPRQATHGMPPRMATGAYTQPVSYMSMPR